MSKVLDFKNYDSWIYEFKGIFESLNYKKYIDCFINDSFSSERDNFKQKIFSEIKQNIHNHYTHIVFYHGTATDNIYSYLDRGLLPLNVKDRYDYARKLLNEKEYPEITNEIFNKAVKEFSKDESYLSLNRNKIYFTIDNDSFKEEEMQHYVCYGGEFLACFASTLSHLTKENYRFELQKKLTPIILKCSVAIELLENNFDDIVNDIFYAFFESVIFPNKRFTIAASTPFITSKIEPKDILGCEFPQDLSCN